MPNLTRSVTRLVDQDDVTNLLSALVDGYALTYDQATQAFTLVRHATKAELDYALSGAQAALTAALATHTADAAAHHTWPLTEPDIPATIARDSELLQVLDTCSPFVVADADGWPLFDAVGELIHAYSDEVLVDDSGDAVISDGFSFILED